MKIYTKKDKEIIGQILYLAADKREHVLKDDCIDWLEEKMLEIERLAKLLPNTKYVEGKDFH